MFTRTASLLSAMTAAVLGLACDRNPADDVAQARVVRPCRHQRAPIFHQVRQVQGH